MSKNRINFPQRDARNGPADGYGHNGQGARNGAAAVAEAPSTPVANGANGQNGAPPIAGRDAAGKFTKGNQAARGRANAFYRRQASLRQALVEEVGEEGLRQLARKLLAQALAGDVAAARTLLAYLVGKPRPAADPDRVDLDEMQLIRERPSDAEILLHLIDGVPPGAAAAAIQSTEKAEESPAELIQRVAGRRPTSAPRDIIEEKAVKRRRRKKG
jgi:hypothetical protein